MTITSPTAAELIREARRVLAEAGVDSLGLDAEILMRDTLQVSREELLLSMQETVPPSAVAAFRARVQQRLDGVPIAYLIGKREFYGREFHVSPAVLVPRPETELLVEGALRWLRGHGRTRRRIIDVGTGSGAIAVSIAAETSGDHHVLASDVSLDALEVAQQNSHRHGARVEFIAGSLLDWCGEPIDLIIANLPYLRPDQAHEGIRHEPPLALFAGEHGFALNQQLIRQASSLLLSPGALLMEIDPAQADLAERTARPEIPDADVRIETDLAGLARVLVVQRN
jgi:release factor glutamine methyltransferase